MLTQLGLLRVRLLSEYSWSDVSESLRKSLQRQALVAVDVTWMYVYLGALLLSFVGTVLAGYHMRKLGGDLFRSTVRFVIASFLFFSSIKALVGAILYTALSIELQQYLDVLTTLMNEYSSGSGSGSGSLSASDVIDMLTSSSSSSNSGASGETEYLAKLIADAEPLSNTLTTLLLADNALFLLTSYWIFLVARELFKLAMTTFDRGSENELRTIRMYIAGAVFILVCYFAYALPIVISDSGYSNALSMVSNIETGFSIFSVLYSSGALIVLRCSGRKHEHIHGKVIRSPLYQRLKNLMIVCAVFTLPFAILQICLLNLNWGHVENIPNEVVGLVTTLYFLFGAAQSLIMGGSLQCCIRILNPIIPAHVKQSIEWKRMRSLRRHDSAFGIEYTEAPEKPIFVYTDIESSSALWAQAPENVMDEAQDMHDDLLRYALPLFHGYEITTVGDAFQLAFHTIEEAVAYCLEVQLRLLNAKWPSELEGITPSTKTEWVMDGLKPQILFRGIRVRMGIHDASVDQEGDLVMHVHPVTGKAVYIGASELIAREVGDVGFGGQIIVSERIAEWLQENSSKLIVPYTMDYYGSHEVELLELDVDLYEITPKIIANRHKLFQKRRGIDTSEIEIIVGEEYDGNDDAMNELQTSYSKQFTPHANEVTETV